MLNEIYDYPNVPWDALYNVVSWERKRFGKFSMLSNIIGLDTETARYNDDILFITDWSLTIESFGCIYGHTIQDMIQCIKHLIAKIGITESARMIIYIHNLSYDYMFIRNHLFAEFGFPVHAISTNPHKYILLRFACGIEFRDSYILTGRSLERFVSDMGTPVKKAVGSWDYDKFRTPGSARTADEKNYACSDTIALVQALRIFFNQHNSTTADIEYTNTGFVRSAGLKASKSDKGWRYKFRRSRLDFNLYCMLDDAFHGGYTHANRYYIGQIMHDVISYDFASSYPARMLYNKFPMGEWHPFESCTVYDIITMQDVFAFAGYLLLANAIVHKDCPMPPIMKYKCKVLENPIIDNGRIIKADLLVIPFTDPDLETILEFYDYDYADVKQVMYCNKEYLPNWFCDLIMDLFRNKTTQKGKDNVLYMLSKGMLNALYGMCVQKIVRQDLIEDYETGEWIVSDGKKDRDLGESQLNSFYDNRKKYLPFQWGCWVTAYAQRELFALGKLCGTWLYSDTDSVKGKNWDLNGLAEYNKNIEQIAEKRGYGSIEYNGKRYTLGIAEFDGNYQEFVTLGSKRYCYRENGTLHITVAGVPKIGVSELKNDIRNFKQNMVFKDTNKQAATYIYHDGIKEIKIDKERIEYGCSVRLDSVEYTLDMTVLFNKETGLPYSEF